MATKKSTSSKLPKGMYELRIKGRREPLIVQLQAIPIGTIYKLPNHTKNTDTYYDSDKGTDKYYIVCARLSIYTTIGADNRHHAANKATKLFGPNWSSLTQADRLVDYLQFTSVTTFKKLLSSL